MRKLYKWLLCLTPVTLGLFFGLFFGLNYPEIVRHGWPLSSCTILSSTIAERYCCETSCQTNSCQSAPSGSPQCQAQISMLDGGYSPSACAANSSACPLDVPSTCDGGEYCCDTCCSTCQSCTTSCNGKTCSQSCTSYSCNCYCCSSTNDLFCTLTCPTCYTADLQLSYSTTSGQRESNISYTQDFGKDQSGAQGFANTHTEGSTTSCHYNPQEPDQVLLNVGFTTWKWVVSAIFGMAPLLTIILIFTFFVVCIPCCGRLKEGYEDRKEAREERKAVKEKEKVYTHSKTSLDSMTKMPEPKVVYM